MTGDRASSFCHETVLAVVGHIRSVRLPGKMCSSLSGQGAAKREQTCQYAALLQSVCGDDALQLEGWVGNLITLFGMVYSSNSSNSIIIQRHQKYSPIVHAPRHEYGVTFLIEKLKLIPINIKRDRLLLH